MGVEDAVGGVSSIAVLLVAGLATALATGLGAIPVFMLGERAERLRPALGGLAGGAMVVASIVGLLLPGLDEGATGSVLAGVGGGVVFLLVVRGALERRREHARRLAESGITRSVLVFVALLVHSLPEGLAMGAAYASETAGLGLFVILAIALQNLPEGTAMALPMEAAHASRSRQFWTATATSLPQPVGAVLAFLLVEQAQALLPLSFGFAAGAMLALVVVELVPSTFGERDGWPLALAGSAAGAAIMLALGVVLGV